MEDSTIPIEDIFPGACTLSSAQRKTRGKFIRSKVISTFESYEEVEKGYVFLYQNNEEMAHILLDFILAEQLCCSFIDFNLGFRTSDQKIALEVSASTTDTDKFKGSLRHWYSI